MVKRDIVMNKTIFYIKDMDCPSEEQMIRMKLADINSVKRLSFDLPNRNLTIYHRGELDKISSEIKSLKLGSKLVKTTKSKVEISQKKDVIDKKLLWAVLIINFSFFIIEAIFGLISDSIGLLADSFDMLADTFVYGLSLYAITGTLFMKKRIARISGIFQLLLALLGFAEVIRRFIAFDAIPNSLTMISVSFFALIANVASLIILNRSQNNEVHIQSSKIFTSNDVIANIGVIIAGVLVYVLNSKIPDLIVGSIVFLLVLRGALRILKLSK
jgi:Co/Zn/Cd efflux system component